MFGCEAFIMRSELEELIEIIRKNNLICTIAPACADRSGGPAMKPKPGDSYETGADGAGGWPSGAAETLRPRGDAVRARGNAVESCRVTTCPELRW